MKNQTPEERIRNFEKKQFVVSGLGLIIFCGLAVLANSLHLQSVAEDSTRFISRMIKIGDFREASLILHEARLANFKSIRYESSQPGRSFSLPPEAELSDSRGLWNSLTIESAVVPVAINLSSGPSDQIIFEFDRFRFIPYAFFMWLLLNLVSIPQTRFLKRRMVEQFKMDLELEKKLVKSELAAQVRHNLRTPVAALMRIPKRLPDSVAGDRELLEITIRQIRELISKLDDKPADQLQGEYESNLYNTLIRSKRELDVYVSKNVDLQFDVDESIASAIVKHVPYELRAILGNLVTNSIEAFATQGKVVIVARDTGVEIVISVTDSGRGIEPGNLSQIFNKKVSIGKLNGSGIGLSHAKTQIESWDGSIQVESRVGVGTKLTLKLPIEDRESWYIPRLKFNSSSRIYVLDDQVTARELWRLRLQDAGLLQVTTFASEAKDLVAIQDEVQRSPQDCTLLFDYDLGATETGLQWLERMPKSATRCLVTGHFDNQEVRAECGRIGVYLLAKSQIAEVPFVVI